MSDDLHALTGAYVMDALDEEERAAFEAYMATSPATAAEVASLREAVTMLGTATAETPPEGLRRAVMDRVDTVRQDRPVVAATDDRREGRQAGETLAEPVPLRRRSSWGTRVALAAAAVMAVVSVGLGSAVVDLNQRLEAVEGTNEQVATLLAAPDAHTSEAGLPDGGVITALISPGHGAAIAVAEGLPELSEDQMYALWAIVDDLPVPIGEVVNGQPLSVQVAGFDLLGVTVEPRGELTLPTTAPQVTLEA